MIEASLKVTETFLKYPVGIAKVIVLISFLSKLATKNLTFDLGEACVSLIKCLSYGALAWFIFVNTKNLEQIDVLTYFTFLLACIEVGHNFANSIVLSVIVVLKGLFKIIKGGQFDI